MQFSGARRHDTHEQSIPLASIQSLLCSLGDKRCRCQNQEALASETGELCAVLRWIANDESDRAIGTEPIRSELLSEMGDVAVLLLLLCQRVGTHLDEVVLEKLAANGLKYPVNESKGRAEKPTT